MVYVLLGLLVVSLLLNGWLISDRYRRWQWKRRKPAGSGRAARPMGGRR